MSQLTTQVIEKRLKFLTGVIRKRYLDGEISQAEAMGCEVHSTSASYRACKPIVNMPIIKSEPGVNATENSKPRLCFYCRKAGHFMAQCPRKNSGLSPAAAAVESEAKDANVENEDAENDDEEVNYVRNAQSAQRYRRENSNRRYEDKQNAKPYDNRYRKPSYNKKKNYRFNPRVAVVYEDETGNLCVDDHEDATEIVDEKPGVNVVEMAEQYEDGYTEADFIPSAFLGM